MKRKHKQLIKHLVAASLGGVLGALTTSWLGRAGLKRSLAAIGVTAVGTITAGLTRGTVRAGATGVAAAAAGSLAATWFAALDARIRGAETHHRNTNTASDHPSVTSLHGAAA